MQNVGKFEASGIRGGLSVPIKRIVSRYRTRIYAALGGAAFSVLALPVVSSPLIVLAVAGLASVIAAVLIPRYAAIVVAVENAINSKMALVTPGRLARVLLLVPILAIAAAAIPTVATTMSWGEILALLGGIGGLNAIGVTLAYHGRGEQTGNTVLAMSAGIWLVGLSGQHWSLWPLTLALDAVFLVHAAVGLLSDLRSRLYPKGGIGVFFGSFNPVHKMHLRLLKDLLEQRALDKIYVHATTIPKLHRDALLSGEIEVDQRAGIREYRKSRIADPGKNYFPTGNWFYEYDLRLELLRAAIRDAGLEAHVEILDLPDIYERSGFAGVIRYVRARHRGQPIHGLHGSDAGGMWVRNIFDGSGWIYPFPVARAGPISATAIRQGAIGMTSATVESFLAAQRRGEDFIFPSGYVYRNC